MLLIWRHGHSRSRDYVSSLTVSLSHKIHLFHWFIGWRFCICTWPIRSSLFRYLNLHVFLSILYNLYDSMIVWWVLIRGFTDPRLSLYVQVLFSYASLYRCSCVCVCRHFHVVPLCSRHDLITLRFHYPGPLLPSSLASQDYLVWYLRCVAGQPYLYVWYGFSYHDLGSVYAPFSFLSIRGSFIFMEHLVYLV